MTSLNDVHAQNAASTQRLRDLVDQLRPEDYRIDLGGGWTIGIALAHLAFWDARQSAALHRMQQTGSLPAEDPAVNPAIEALGAVCQTPIIGAVAIDAANTLDRDLAQLSSEQHAALRDAGYPHLIERWSHRDEHAEQIHNSLHTIAGQDRSAKR